MRTQLSRGVWWMQVPQKPNPVARFWYWWLATLCERTGHVYGCLLLNSFGIGKFGRLWHRSVKWAVDASADWRWVRMDGLPNTSTTLSVTNDPAVRVP